MKKYFIFLGTLSALALCSPASSAATIVDVGTMATSPTSPYFYITSGTAMGPAIHATFGATPTGPGTMFDYLFQFHVQYDGIGSGSLTTSFAGTPDINVSSVIINNTPYTPAPVAGAGQTLNVGNIPLFAGALDTIEVKGSNDSLGGPFAGTVAYVASVPEPATWTTFLLGFGFMGLAIRRRAVARLQAA